MTESSNLAISTGAQNIPPRRLVSDAKNEGSTARHSWPSSTRWPRQCAAATTEATVAYRSLIRAPCRERLEWASGRFEVRQAFQRDTRPGHIARSTRGRLRRAFESGTIGAPDRT